MTKSMQFIDLAEQYKFLKDRIDRRISEVLDHGQFIMGPEVNEFEQKLAEYVGTKHAISCANGTDALTLALMAMGIGKGDVVFVPTFTFFASAEAIAFCGATPIFVDSEAETFNISSFDLEKKIRAIRSKSKLLPRAIMLVNLFGLPADYWAIKKVADEYGLKIIEDSAQGFGGSINGRMAGSFGDIATTSFFPAKPLGCYGDGGALFTQDDEYADLIRSLRVHGKGSNKYHNVRIGMNSRLDTIQAAILIEKLRVFPKELVKRNELACFYSAELSHKFDTPTVQGSFISSWAQYTLTAENPGQRDRIVAHLKQQGIPTVIYYPTCMHQQPAFEMNRSYSFDCPVAERLASVVFSIPMNPYMRRSDAQKVVDAMLSAPS